MNVGSKIRELCNGGEGEIKLFNLSVKCISIIIALNPTWPGGIYNFN
jgi:hypothetical protein